MNRYPPTAFPRPGAFAFTATRPLALLLALAVIPLVAALIATPTSEARSFRALKPIATPQNLDKVYELDARPLAPGEMRPVDAGPLPPVDAAYVREALDQLAAAWNSTQLEQYLAADFQNRDQLLDLFASDVPQDARLIILKVNAIRTLSQELLRSEGGLEVMSMVSVQAQTRIEFFDPGNGLVRIDGNADYLLRIFEVVE